jgi:hypothetical protein
VNLWLWRYGRGQPWTMSIEEVPHTGPREDRWESTWRGRGREEWRAATEVPHTGLGMARGARTTSPYSGIVHQLSAPNKYALTQTFHSRSWSVDGAPSKRIPPTFTFILHPRFATLLLAYPRSYAEAGGATGEEDGTHENVERRAGIALSEVGSGEAANE